MQQNKQVVPLHANKRIMLNNIVFDERAKMLDHPRATIKIKNKNY